MKMPELIFTKDVPLPKFQISDSPAVLEIKMKTMVAVLDKESGTLSFKDDAGNVFL